MLIQIIISANEIVLIPFMIINPRGDVYQAVLLLIMDMIIVHKKYAF